MGEMNPGHNGVLSEGEAPVEADVEGCVVGDAQAGFKWAKVMKVIDPMMSRNFLKGLKSRWRQKPHGNGAYCFLSFHRGG